MCGILGLVGPKSTNLPESSGHAHWRHHLKQMNDSQIHRGPDDEGYYFCDRDHVALAMRRLSILDLSGGHQPMSTPDGGLWIVFNGEIFNAPELRRNLIHQGFEFKTENSDTEVLLHMYARYGKDMLQYLNGMFGFVIHDKGKKLLFGARDRLGIKPLYYSHSPHGFAFASELKSLLELPWINRDLDHQSLFHYFSFQCVPAPRSIIKSVSKLSPAHYFELDLNSDRFRTESYWKPSFSPELNISEKELPKYIRHELEAAVGRWMLSDVPIACSLSGGIDSSAIVGIISMHQRGDPLKTYSLGFHDAPELDERHLARLVAQKWGTEHHEIVISAKELLQNLGPMIHHLDEPYAGGLPSWFVFREMAKDVKVAMTGTGGDELFGNYGKWIPYQVPHRRLKRFLRYMLEGNDISDYWNFRTGFFYPIYFRDASKRKTLFRPEIIQNVMASEELLESYWRLSESSNPRDTVPSIDLKIQLPEEFLHMTDRFSMAFSLEARTPFLDHLFVEKILKIPAYRRTSYFKLKYLLIDAVKDLLPGPLISERKRYFALPVASWLRSQLRESVQYFLGENYVRQQGLFRPEYCKQLLSQHLDQGKDMAWQIWTIYMFQLWYERYIRNQNVSTVI